MGAWIRPCGSEAAYARHRRDGEPPCAACRTAHARAKAIRDGRVPESPDLRPLRNGLPLTPGYQWRARTYPWAVRALAAAEAIHGRPEVA